jgi:hypothetical protein
MGKRLPVTGVGKHMFSVNQKNHPPGNFEGFGVEPHNKNAVVAFADQPPHHRSSSTIFELFCHLGCFYCSTAPNPSVDEALSDGHDFSALGLESPLGGVLDPKL